MKDKTKILDNIKWPLYSQNELDLKKSMSHERSSAQISITDSLSLKSTFITPDAVRPVGDKNIVCLNPCQKFKDYLLYHEELLIKVRENELFKRIHDEIRVQN